MHMRVLDRKGLHRHAREFGRKHFVALFEKKKNMEQISRFLHGESNGCVLCLETRESVLVDNEDRPILLSIGMVHGTDEEMLYQVEYAMERARAYDVSKGVCTIIEASHTSFRFPNTGMLRVFRLLQRSYVSMCVGPIHFVGMSERVRRGFHLSFKLLPRMLKRKFVVHDSWMSLVKCLPVQSRLCRWSGDVVYDLDAYVKRRCEQEGTVPSTETINFGTSPSRRCSQWVAQTRVQTQ